MQAALINEKRPSSAIRRAATILLLAFGCIVVFAGFLAPYDPAAQSRRSISAPPSTIHFRGTDGNIGRPFIYQRRLVDPLMLRYEETETRQYPVGFFVQGDAYHLLGLIQTRTHLFGVVGDDPEAPRLNLLGTDELGRDRFSRLLLAVRFSLLVCPIGAALACLIGVFVGLASGYANRTIDTALMGVADSMLALPTLILILAARAAFPLELPPSRAAMLLILIFALTGWAPMARLTRGVVRSLKQKDFVLAARSIGLGEARVLFRHILPNAAPVLITQALIMLPSFLLAEVALSYLGVGVQEPEPSLGNMLAAAGDITQLARQPLLLLSPAIVIFIFVLAVRTIVPETSEGRDSTVR
ncbi:MAG: ABC transporter permease [Pyrinomonadaceae bacterium]